ncbi:hypothetical protein DQ240_02930 [Blastococcus sp. TF02A-26]|nr:hypothetical protein DQ240_02930 [Blastococcus sp. TF02A-26]
MACDATVARIVIGPDGQPIDRGREVRIVPPALRHLLDLRDGGTEILLTRPDLLVPV